MIVASVSCIYGLGSPEEYEQRVVFLNAGEEHDRDLVLRKLVDIQYVRNDTLLGRGRFRVKGDVLELQPAYSETAYRVSFFGDEVEAITHFDPLTGEVLSRLDSITVFPATQYVTSKPTIERAVGRDPRRSSTTRCKQFEAEGRMLEAHRIRQRTEYDLEMMQELGFCNGIENYSRILDGRPPGSAPHTLLDYFPSDFVVFVDESHQTVPQIGGMYEGDRSRKQTLVDFGFRLPSALDNRPLRFDEFLAKVPQLVLVSATPGAWELRHSTRVAEQLIRPTGIVDPEVELRPTRNQIDDLLNEIRRREEVGERTLVTTLTKKMAEDLTDYLLEAGVARALPALRDRHARADPDHPRPAARRVRRPRRRQPPPRGPRPARGLARRDPRRRQGGLPARPDGADPDDRPRGAQHQRQGADVRRQAHRGDQVRARGDRAAARQAARLQRGARDHARVDLEGRLRHRRVPDARGAARAASGTRRGAQGRGDGPRRAREARDHARGGDVHRRRGAALRVRREAPRRDQGAPPRAAGAAEAEQRTGHRRAPGRGRRTHDRPGRRARHRRRIVGALGRLVRPGPIRCRSG